MTHTRKTIPAAVEVNGAPYLPGQGGNLVPVANIKRQDLLRHETTYELTDYALDLSAEIARFNGHSRADLAAFDALLAEEYGVTRDPNFQGNRTYTSLDGERQIKIAIGKHVSFGVELQVAKKLLDEMIQENAAAAGPVLMPLVNQAFRVDKEGKVDADMLRAIRRLEIPDPRWSKIVKAIDDAEDVRDTTTYIRFYRKGVDGKMTLIPLDIAAAHPTPEALMRRSLRRQVEEANAAFTAIKGELDQLGDVFPEGLDLVGQVTWAIRRLNQHLDTVSAALLANYDETAA